MRFLDLACIYILIIDNNIDDNSFKYLSRNIIFITKLERLDLSSNNKINHYSICDFLSKLSMLKNLKSIEMMYMPVKDDGFRILINNFTKLTSLVQLNLKSIINILLDSGITDMSFIYFFENIHNLHYIKTVRFGNNNITDKGINELITMNVKCNSLSILHMSRIIYNIFSLCI